MPRIFDNIGAPTARDEAALRYLSAQLRSGKVVVFEGQTVAVGAYPPLGACRRGGTCGRPEN